MVLFICYDTGVLMGMSNTWATIPGFLGPAVVGWLTHKHVTIF